MDYKKITKNLSLTISGVIFWRFIWLMTDKAIGFNIIPNIILGFIALSIFILIDANERI